MLIELSPVLNHGVVLVEAKRAADRETIGQILDYQRVLETEIRIRKAVCVAFEAEYDYLFLLTGIELSIPSERDAKRILAGKFS